jgi:putative transposase
MTPVALPAKRPVLNPTENVWEFLRDNWPSNRIFQSYDDLLDHCCESWNKLLNQPWRIMSLGLRQGAHGFSSVRVGVRFDPVVRHCCSREPKKARRSRRSCAAPDTVAAALT